MYIMVDLSIFVQKKSCNCVLKKKYVFLKIKLLKIFMKFVISI